MASDQYEFGSFNYDDEAYNAEPGSADESDSSAKEILGLSIPEFAILGVLFLVICVLGVFVGLSFFRTMANHAINKNIVQTTEEFPTPIPSATAVVKSTPIPGWNKFEFAASQAEIWLPASYQGGDPVAYPEIVALTIDVFVSDEPFAAYAKELISDPAITFFAFDTEPSEVWRSTYVYKETISPNLDLSMDEYLNLTIEKAADREFRVTNQYITDLDYYSGVGVLIFEERVPLTEGANFFIKYYLFAIRFDGEIWNIVYQINRDDAASYADTIFNSARGFYMQP